MAETPWRQPRTLADFGGIDGLRPAERRLLAERDTGLPVVLGDGKRPPEHAPADRWVRASFLRWLILGAEGAEGRTHEKGVQVVGAFIESDGLEAAETRGLDLAGCTVAENLALLDCWFHSALLLRSARLATLYLNDSYLPRLVGDGLVTTSGVFLRGIRCNGEIRLRGARIGHDLDCDGAILCNSGVNTLSADGIQTAGSVFLRNGFSSEGQVRLLGALIGGDLSCVGAKLNNTCGNALSADGIVASGDVFLRSVESDGKIRLLGARIGGNLDCQGAKLRSASGSALDASGARISGALFLNHAATVSGRITLIAAEIGSIVDDPGCWPATVRLDRCTYKSFSGREWTVKERIAWLDKHDPPDGFRPQPWEQCANVLRESGHAEDAQAVLIAKEVRQRRARRHAATPLLWRGLFWIWDGLLSVTVRYGRAPMLAFAWLAAVWLVGAAVFWDAERAGALRPNDGGAIASAAWQGCAGAAPSRMACWQATSTGRDWPAFQPVVHSLDLTLPVVDLDMARWWTPDEGADWRWAAATRTWAWVQMGLGWFLSLLAVAGFSGIVKSD